MLEMQERLMGLSSIRHAEMRVLVPGIFLC